MIVQECYSVVMAVSEEQLALHAKNIRLNIIKMLLEAGSGHPGGSLGMTDVFTSLYFAVLDHRPHDPYWPDRDYFLLSNGHICPAWYATLAEAGYFDSQELVTLRQLNSRLQGHPHLNSLPGIENSSGPLGLGLSQAVGLSLGLRMDGKKNRVYVMMGDGEQQEGQNWEAYWLAGVNRLSNLTVLLDRNNIQIDGFTEDVLPLEPLIDKLEAFRWHVISIDGHNYESIIDACHQAEAIQERPTAIICNTIPGKGVEFMENLPEWHGKPPTAAQAKQAIDNLSTLGDRISYD